MNLERQMPEIEGLYLRHNLREIAEKLGRPIVIANYVTDKNDVIALKSTPGAAREVKNEDDWKLFQELTAQADAIITGTNYLKEFKKRGQNVLTQFDLGGEYEHLGDWRLNHGYSSRNPDIVVMSRSLDFEIPKGLAGSSRKIIVFTTYDRQHSQKAEELRNAGAVIIGAGEAGVDGKKMIQELKGMGYQVIRNTTGPRVLKVLLDAGVLDRLYITQVRKAINAKKDDTVTVLDNKKISELEGFKLIEKHTQDNVVTADNTQTSQEFLVYEKTRS